MTLDTDYQTVPLPDGTWARGLFPTDKWFEKIAAHVDFKGRSVDDLGCCQFSYGIQALNEGARFVAGIDNSKQRVDQSWALVEQWGLQKKAMVVHGSIEELPTTAINPGNKADITIWSMIIHWLSTPQQQIQRLKGKTNVFIYRYPQDRAEDTGWRPTLDELDAAMGFKHKHAEKLSDTEAQNIMLTIYKE